MGETGRNGTDLQISKKFLGGVQYTQLRFELFPTKFFFSKNQESKLSLGGSSRFTARRRPWAVSVRWQPQLSGPGNFEGGICCQPYRKLHGGQNAVLIAPVLSDIPGQSGSPAVLPGVFSQLPGSCLIGVSHFPYSGPEVLRSSFPGPSSSSHLGRDVSGPLSQR